MSMSISSLKKFTGRAISYLLDSPQQNPSLVAYTRYSLPYRYEYKRPAFLELDEDATQASADHEIRPVMHPKRPLVMDTGYAEVINAGKTARTNEDQCCFHSLVITVPVNKRDESWTTDYCQIPCIYFAVFDGHAGTGAALSAYHTLHHHVKEQLTDVAHMLILTPAEISNRYLTTGLITTVNAEQLIIGALEKAFLALDEDIKQQRYDFRIDGGCTALVTLFILGKLFIANAGDCRGVLYKDNKVCMSTHDHTPETERKRVQRLAFLQPSLTQNEYTPFQFQHRCRKKDLGTRQLYRDHNMDGWGLKVIDKNDMKPQVVCGEGKRARLLDTIGTTRGFGDHDLEVPYCSSIKIKPFLTAAPDVYVYDLANKTFGENDVLVMATDGLWERLTNTNVLNILTERFVTQREEEPRRYIVAAQSLVDEARGVLGERGWRMLNNETASYDDISTLVIPLKGWRDAVQNILQLHREERGTNTRSIHIDEYLNIPSNEDGGTKHVTQQGATTHVTQVHNVHNATQPKKITAGDHHMTQSELDDQKVKHDLESISRSYDQVYNVDIPALKKSKHASDTVEESKHGSDAVEESKIIEAMEISEGGNEKEILIAK